MPLTLLDAANNSPNKDNRLIPNTSDIKDPNINKVYDKSNRKIISDKFDNAYGKDDDDNNKILKYMHRKITTDYADHAAHVSGYYYIQMIHGTWAETVGSKNGTPNNSKYGNYSNDTDNSYRYNNDTSVFTKKHFKAISQNFGQLATDIDIPQLNIEYETISGKSKNLNYASRIQFASDFSINYIENYTNHIIRYHEAWFKYIDALKKGYINMHLDDAKDSDYFIDVPYFNAVWVVIFAPFTTNIRGLIKIMGVSPINLPIKQIIGNRSKNELTTINQNYKSNDMLYKFFDTDEDRKSSPFYQEFIKDMNRIIE